MDPAHQTLADLATEGRKLRDAIPGVYAAYAAMGTAAMGEGGALSPKIRELIALAISVSKQCDGCIASHARGAAKQGATTQEVAEMLGVVIFMNGGPGTVWAARANAAFAEFSSSSGA